MSSIAHVCRNCGGAFGFPLSEATFPCPACGALHARPKSEGESLTWLRRANEERAACEFAHAEATYRQVLGRHPEEHEALWGLVMCKYGVELVEGKPTIHFHRRKDIITDPDFVRACALAGEEVARQYRDQAEYISAIQRSIPAGDEKPFDVFLCYRAGGAQQGQFAREYYHAYELYLELQKQGYRVFFAHVTLRDQAGASYEARIFHALYSAPAMLVVCSDAENLLSPWVHSEWSRYLERVNAGEGCRLIPMLYDGCNPYALPHELQMLQCVTVGQADWWGQLQENLQKVIRREQGGAVEVSDETGKRLLAIEYALSGGSWNEAAQAAEALRKAQPDCAKAYLYKLLAKMRLAEPDGLAECETAFEDDPDWKWALRLASPAEKAAWTGFLAASQELRRQREEERHRAEEERRRAEEERRAREAEERRRAEEERRRAEEERRAREAREAEERRREEQARRTRELAERQQRIKTQEEETWRLLEAGKWDEAAAAADRIPSSDRGDKALLMLLAKYHLPSIAALAKSDKAFMDHLIERAIREAPDEERREQLQQLRKDARQRLATRIAWAEFLGKLLPALWTVLLMLASALLPLVLPDHAGRITLGVELVAVVLMCVYDVLVWRNAGGDKDEYCDLIIVGDVGCGVLLIALLCVSLFVHLPMWETLALAFAGALVMACVLTGVRAGIAESGCRAVRAHVFYTGMPLLWLVLHLAGRLLLCIFTPGWLVVVANVVTYGLGGVVLLTTLVIRCDR